MRFLACLCIITAVAFAVPQQLRAAAPDAALEQALGSNEPLYKYTPDALVAAVKLCASRDHVRAGDYVALVLNSGRNDADAIAPSLVKAAIEGLGVDPKPELIGAIVRAAVKIAPTEVLDIVTAAVKASPRSAAPAIVSAAVSSVPHPEEMVTMDMMRRNARQAYGNDKQADNKEVADGKQIEKQMTLAEAIVQAALDADPGLSADTLTAAVDPPLVVSDPNPPPPIVLPPVTPPTTGGFGAPGPVSP